MVMLLEQRLIFVYSGGEGREREVGSMFMVAEQEKRETERCTLMLKKGFSTKREVS